MLNTLIIKLCLVIIPRENRLSSPIYTTAYLSYEVNSHVLRLRYVVLSRYLPSTLFHALHATYPSLVPISRAHVQLDWWVVKL